MIGLQTAFAVVNTVLPNLSNEKIIALFSGNARNIFDLPTTHVSVGSKAELTLFSRTAETLLNAGNNQSKSANSPFLEKTLTGKAVGIVHKGKLFKQ